MMPTVDVFGLILGGALLVAAFVFGFGRRMGRKEGEQEGMAAAPLQMRRETLEHGRCLLCGQGPSPAFEEGEGGG